MDANYNIGADYTPLPALLAFLSVSQLIDADPLTLGSLCVWREAGGEGPLGKRGVAHVIHNRSLQPGWWGHDWNGVVLRNVLPPGHTKRVFQFSCFNAWDVNALKFPSLQARNWVEIQDMLKGVLADTDSDITDGAQYYHDSSMEFPVTWGMKTDFRLTIHVGRLTFYRYEPILSNHDQVQDASVGEA